MLRRSLQHGRCEIRPECVALELLLDGSGTRSTGVRYLDADGAENTVHANAVIVACGAFETPRLLLRSGVGNSSDLVGRFLMFHLQTIVLGFFPFRLHAYKGRDVTHLMDDPIVGDAETRGRGTAARLPYLRGGIVEHGGSGHPITEASSCRPEPITPRAWSTRPPATRWPRSRCRAKTSRRRRTASISTPACATCGVSRSGRITYQPHAHDVACAHHWAPRLEAVLREAGAQGTSWVTSPGTPGTLAPDLQPISRHWMGTARMGVDPADVGLRSVAATVGRRQRRGHRLIGVPDVHRLRPDAHARRARGTGGPSPGGLDVNRGLVDVSALFEVLERRATPTMRAACRSSSTPCSVPSSLRARTPTTWSFRSPAWCTTSDGWR